MGSKKQGFTLETVAMIRDFGASGRTGFLVVTEVSWRQEQWARNTGRVQHVSHASARRE